VGWKGVAEAHTEILDGIKRYNDAKDKPNF
jgi:hypothetical protein